MPQTQADARAQADRQHSQLDAIVIGAGFAGMYMVHKLRELGFSVHGFEAGEGVGGTWYWDRYPGQPVILKYLNLVADRLQLRDYFTFNAKVVSSVYGEDTNTWTIRTED